MCVNFTSLNELSAGENALYKTPSVSVSYSCETPGRAPGVRDSIARASHGVFFHQNSDKPRPLRQDERSDWSVEMSVTSMITIKVELYFFGLDPVRERLTHEHNRCIRVFLTQLFSLLLFYYYYGHQNCSRKRLFITAHKQNVIYSSTINKYKFPQC